MTCILIRSFREKVSRAGPIDSPRLEEHPNADSRPPGAPSRPSDRRAGRCAARAAPGARRARRAAGRSLRRHEADDDPGSRTSSPPSTASPSGRASSGASSRPPPFWRKEDGDEKAFADAGPRGRSPPTRSSATRFFSRMEFALESLDGHMNEIARDFKRQSDLDLGEIYPFDEILAGLRSLGPRQRGLLPEPAGLRRAPELPPHDARAAPPGRTAAGRAASGPRRAWPSASPSASRPTSTWRSASAHAEAARYIAQYNIWMHHLVDAKGQRLFPEGLRLLSHWNLRDEIKADYSDAQNGLAKQRAIAQVMDRIVTQTIPAAVVDNPHVDWNPFTNEVTRDDGARLRPARRRPTVKVTNAPGARHALRDAAEDLPGRAQGGSVLADRADADRAALRREPPDPRGAREGDARGGPLLAAGPQGRRAHLEAARPPARALRRLVQRLPAARRVHRGASSTRSSARSTRPPRPTRTTSPTSSPGSASPRRRRSTWPTTSRSTRRAAPGHALGAARRADHAHLRTRVEKGGMNYKGYNIAVHEMGHNVEQTFSLNDDRLDAARGRAQHRVHRGARVRLPGARPRAAGPRQARREEPGAQGARTTSGRPTRSRASRSSTWPSGTGCTTTPTRRRRS